MAYRDRLISFLTTVRTAESSHSVESAENTLVLSSTSTEEVYEQTCGLKTVTLQDGKQVVDDIVNKMFDKSYGMVHLSSSACSMSSDLEESTKMDNRLKMWYETLQDRSKMQWKIQRKLGRRPDEMLFNMPTTIDHRDKGMVQRLMDYADRMNPVTLTEKTASILPSRHDPETCQHVHQLQETLPKAERRGKTTVEISGLTKTTMEEIMGPGFDYTNIHSTNERNEKSKWINSQVLGERLDKKCKDLKRVLNFYPDVENLEVVGNNMLYDDESDIEKLSYSSLYSISSSTKESVNSEMQETEEQQDVKEEKPDIIRLGLKINDKVCVHSNKQSARSISFEINFECEPYERVLKEVLRLENIGSQLISCHWISLEYYKRNATFLAANSDCFAFDRDHFILFPGDIRVCKAIYQPRHCSLHKQRWELKIFPNVFCIKRDTIVVKLHGKCVPALEYIESVNKQTYSVIAKANKHAMDKVTGQQASLVPIIQPQEVTCPYQRVFDDREIFNAENKGYHCERFDDLEQLKNLYDTLKKPREPAWDLQVETIKRMILRLPEAEPRESSFKKLNKVLDTLKCGMGDVGEKKFQHFGHSTERSRSRFIYVRGCLANGIEEWEDIMLSIEQSSLKTELTRFYARKANEAKKLSQEDSSEDDEIKPWLRKLRQDNPKDYVLKKLRAKKYYRDSLYMQTYSHLCDVAENVVSVIESTECV
ncbi:uncharacterized protein [Drosophila tropicalis]|uniref:uncharacterized protein n=1 Tax=Drosophila tropicalis TaxID=46794 RepID=UPI0035ABC378